MIQKKLIHHLALLILASSLFACTSVDTQDEESMMSMDSDVSAAADSGDDVAGEDFADDEFAANDSGSGSTDVAANDDFAADEFGDEDFDSDDFGSEPTAEQTPPPAPLAQDEIADDFQSDVEASEEIAAIPEPPPIEEPAPIAEPIAPPPSIAAEPSMSAPEATANITNIRFKSTPGGGMLLIEGDSPLNYQTRLNTDTNQFIIEVPGAKLPERLKRPFLMKEFPTAKFGAVNAYQKPGSSTARIVVQLKHPGEEEPLIEANDNSLSIIPSSSTNTVAEKTIGSPDEDPDYPSLEVQAGSGGAPNDKRILGARSLDEFLMGNNKFYGNPLSIQIKDADIRDVLNFIADESGANLVVSEDVAGKVTIKLRQVPWDQALVTVMKANKLGYVRQGSVIRISKLEALREETNQAREIIKAQKDLRPLRVKVIPVSFAKVEDMVAQFKDFLTKERGSMVADARTSSLIVTDEEEVLERISRLIKELDVEPTQVMIEGKVVEAGESFVQNIGANWSFSGSDISLGNGPQGEVNLTPSLGVRSVAPEAVTQGNFRFGLNIGTMDVLGDLTATLSLAETDSLVKVISSPRIVAMNKEKATIKQETEQVTITTVTDQSGNITRGVTRTPIVVQLTVVPQVTNDANVIMDVEVEREFAGPLLEAVTQARAINSRSAKTKILVRNGQTAVIGGIYQSDTTETNTGVPLLKDIPVLGWLFKQRSKDLIKNELLIFLTPRILNSKTETAKL